RLGVQEVLAAQVRVAVGVAGVDAGGPQGDLHGGVLHGVGDDRVTAELGDPPADAGQAEVAGAHLNGRVHGVDVPNARVGEPAAGDLDGDGGGAVARGDERVRPRVEVAEGELAVHAAHGRSRDAPGLVHQGEASPVVRPVVQPHLAVQRAPRQQFEVAPGLR